MAYECLNHSADCWHEDVEGRCRANANRYHACRESLPCQACAAKDQSIATLRADAEGYEIQCKDFLQRAKTAEAKLALVRERWSAWQKVRVLGICMGERMRLPGAAPDAIIDALDEACR